MISLALVILLLRVFRVRNPSIRAFFLFIPLVRPLLILLEGSARVNRLSFPNSYIALRFPDPLNLIPLNDIVAKNDFSIVSRLIVALVIAVLLVALALLGIRWASFIVFYRRMRRQSLEVEVPESESETLRSLVTDLSRQVGLTRPPEILFTEGGWMTPCAIGWRRPALILDPALVDDLEPDELRAVLAHEMSHIYRRDGLWHWVSVLLRDIQSFSPFSHMSILRLGLEREKACDREAIESFRLPPRLLANCLVKVAKLQLVNESKPLPGYGLGFLKGRHSPLEDRLNYLLDMEHDRNSGKPGQRRVGKIQKAALIAAWIPLVTIQLYVCAWIGDYILVIK
jgi:beta-lactamase regulating signal transducer with metallopeptidase domain